MSAEPLRTTDSDECPAEGATQATVTTASDDSPSPLKQTKRISSGKGFKRLFKRGRKDGHEPLSDDPKQMDTQAAVTVMASTITVTPDDTSPSTTADRPTVYHKLLHQIRNYPKSPTKTPSSPVPKNKTAKKSPLTEKSMQVNTARGRSGTGSSSGSMADASVEGGASATGAAMATSVVEHAILESEIMVGRESPAIAMTTPSFSNGSAELGTSDDQQDWANFQDSLRVRVVIEDTQQKIMKVKEQIKVELLANDGNVEEYLQLSKNADRTQLTRIRQVFEQKNQKSNSKVTHLQQKLDRYQKRIRNLEENGPPLHRQPKEVLRDVQQGLKDVGSKCRDGITGFSGHGRDLVHKLKSRFGSMDNLSNSKENINQYNGSTGLHQDPDRKSADQMIEQLIIQSVTGITDSSQMVLGTFGQSDEESSSASFHDVKISPERIPLSEYTDIYPIIQHLTQIRETQARLQETVQELKVQMDHDFAMFNQSLQALQDDRFHYERLEQQWDDLTDLHQNEIINVKQELASMEEKMEYRLEERARDIQDSLDSYQTRVTKIELIQQHQQVVSMEGLENATARTLVTKLINVVLAILAVMLVLVSTATKMLMPFIRTRMRILTTTGFIVAMVMTWRQWTMIVDWFVYVVQEYRKIVSIT